MSSRIFGEWGSAPLNLGICTGADSTSTKHDAFVWYNCPGVSSPNTHFCTKVAVVTEHSFSLPLL